MNNSIDLNFIGLVDGLQPFKTFNMNKTRKSNIYHTHTRWENRREFILVGKRVSFEEEKKATQNSNGKRKHAWIDMETDRRL